MLVIAIIAIIALVIQRLTNIYTWKRQWLRYIIEIANYAIDTGDTEIKVDIRKMQKTLYSTIKMLVFFWKTPDKMIQDQTRYWYIRGLGDMYKVRLRTLTSIIRRG